MCLYVCYPVQRMGSGQHGQPGARVLLPAVMAEKDGTGHVRKLRGSLIVLGTIKHLGHVNVIPALVSVN